LSYGGALLKQFYMLQQVLETRVVSARRVVSFLASLSPPTW